jgi:hypothetical protein
MKTVIQDLSAVIESILDLFEEHDLSPEQGARVSADVLIKSISMIDSVEEVSALLSSIACSEDLLMTEGGVAPNPVVFRPRTQQVGVLSNMRWGLDPSLLDENN